jgi:hypothetical protein
MGLLAIELILIIIISISIIIKCENEWAIKDYSNELIK